MALLVYSDRCHHCVDIIAYIKTQPALLQILRDAQEEFGWISPEVRAAVAAALAVPESNIDSLTQFYAHLFDEPRGQYRVLFSDNITDRMAGVLWVILVLSIITVSNRIHYTYLALNKKPMPTGVFARFFFWRDERATLPYDIWVVAILAFVWLVPPDWISDPTASGLGLLGYLIN
mgnify:CR=1 FL=1